ncbi:transcriptional regulator, TetR family [Kribbella flavida DSM 17836]|uniref:Transcriptional regulator, TetR family n=1 Tax=Kribbella flavida (strain DSM 17836 / JCM 10339 / NBRC 14399) TaxID=479435 RepID=D2PMT0_KRIFD|nr:TetR/AcrR family transcriptional regulator [Kribbella flavida]ADB32632.1 transcriptional regulator, TetR family [Kribbella flavida DSM 17836]
MGATRTPRGRWIEQGLRMLAAGGPEAVRIEPIAQALGVTKGGFYGYFKNRDALLTEILDTWERETTEALIERVESEGGDARTRLDRLFTLVAAPDVPVTGTAADLAIRDWARRDEQVARRLQRVDDRRMDYLRLLFGGICEDEEDVEVRSLLAFTLRIGNSLVAARHGERTRADVLELTRQWLLR